MENMIWELGKNHSVLFPHSYWLSLPKTFWWSLNSWAISGYNQCGWEKMYKDNAKAMHQSFPVVSKQEEATECSLGLDGHNLYHNSYKQNLLGLISPVNVWKILILTAECWSFPQVTVCSLSTFQASASLDTSLIYKTSSLIKIYNVSLFYAQ